MGDLNQFNEIYAGFQLKLYPQVIFARRTHPGRRPRKPARPVDGSRPFPPPPPPAYFPALMNRTKSTPEPSSLPPPGTEAEVTVERMAYGGKAVALLDGAVTFLPGGAPGDRLRVEVTETRKNYLEARIVEVLEPGPNRVEPRCPYFLRCGGCHLQHLSPEAQATVKHGFVRDAMDRIAKMPEVPVLPTLTQAEPWHYRNKMNFHARLWKEGMAVGLFDWPSEELVDIESCAIQAPALERALPVVRQHLAEAREQGAHGKLGIMLRGDRPPADNVLVMQRWKQPEARLEELAQRLKALESDTGPWSVIDRQDVFKRGTVYNTLAGEGYNNFVIGGVKMRLAPQAFAQVNMEMAGKMLDVIEDFAALTGTETVLDAFCGSGFIAIRLAKTAGVVWGVESSPEAVEDAKRNARVNEATNIRFLRRDTGKAFRGHAFGDTKFDLVVLDPPREGCSRKTVDTLIHFGLPRILYVSCNPTTLARDLRLFADGGYQVKRVQPIDMFPQTYHVESVAQLERVRET